MPATYEPIASTTVGTAVSSVTFDNIPGTYTDLVFVMSYRDTRAQKYSYPAMRVNSDSGSNYSSTRLFADGSSATSSRTTNTTYWTVIGEGAGASSPTGEFAPIIMHIMSYANTAVFKTYLLSSANTSGDGGANIGRLTGLWRSTSAITRIDLYSDGTSGSQIAVGTTLSLYGIKAA